jgi:mono/diheme cytochrome c family protein
MGDIGLSPEGGLNTSCLSPCHGFTGIVEQWKTSTHFATFINTIGTQEVETWTGARSCGNCHAIDGIEQRLLGNVLFASGASAPEHVTEGQINYLNGVNASESSYAGQATVAVVHCTTCHDAEAENDPHLTGEEYSPGSFPLRVPSDEDDQVFLEKSSDADLAEGTAAGAYGTGNACMWCHKSRKDVSDFVSGTVNVSSVHWGPHSGPHADVFSGVGGYHYTGQSYGNSTHQTIENGCVGCHMPEVESNQGVGDHSFYPKIEPCQECHATATNFDFGGGWTDLRDGIRDLRRTLSAGGYLTRETSEPALAELTDDEIADNDFYLDEPVPQSIDDTDIAGALYNYLLVARGSAGGLHNPLYVRQLVFDSHVAADPDGDPPATMSTRPGTP